MPFLFVAFLKLNLFLENNSEVRHKVDCRSLVCKLSSRGPEHFGPEARFSKVPTLFGPISGDIILFVSRSDGVSRHETLQLF